MTTDKPMKIENLTVKATQEEILRRVQDIEKADIYAEFRPSLIAYLDYEHAKPFLKDEITAKEWIQKRDKELQEDVLLYFDWWGEKIVNNRGISVHRGRAQMVNRLFLAGIEVWKEIGIDDDEGMDGGWYQANAYNKVADLFNYPHKQG